MTPLNTVLVALGLAAGGILLGLAWGLWAGRRRLRRWTAQARAESEGRLREMEAGAERRVREAQLAAKDEVLRSKETLEREVRGRIEELQKLERRLLQREESLDRKLDNLDQKEHAIRERERELGAREATIERLRAEAESLRQQELRKLEEVAGMSAESAKGELMARFLDEARVGIAKEVQRLEREARAKVDREARKVLALAVERYAADHVAEATVCVVGLPNDEMKGRIIGREGRNIRAFEATTGADLIIDDTPEAVVISSFDPVRREVARIALGQLVADGRIHPGRIEDVVAKTRKEVDRRIQEAGEQAAFEVGVEDLHPELVKVLGRLLFRTSYSQNVLQHSKEVAFLAGMMAAELGVEEKMARRCGLLHDLGKAATHESEGSHIQIGIDLAKKYGEPPQVLNAIAAHHEGAEATCLESILVNAADALSAARPGARREMVESYIKRVESLEALAKSFKGVEKCYAIQAGREVRVVVLPEEVSDTEAAFLAQDIARRIEAELSYPGEVRVTIIRETRASATAH